ncbi:MAG: AAA family ATPase [Leptospira sp.]|nr:AAA family ATPase [Leptospira sp.]
MGNNKELSREESAEIVGMDQDSFDARALELKLPGFKTNKIKKSTLEKYFTLSVDEEFDSHVIAISNQKGGEGKTTVSICLGEALSRSGKTLLIDWDPQANATNLFHKDIKFSVMDSLGYRGKKSVSLERIILPLDKNYDLAPSALDLANFTTAYERDDFELLKEALLPIRSKYKYIIIDCPPSLGLILENALIAADFVLVPIQTRAFSVQGLKDLHETIEKIRKKANPRLKLLGAVLNQYEGQKALSGLATSIKKYFPVFKTLLYRRESIPQSQAKMSLLSHYDSQALQYFLDLAEEVKGKLDV